MRRCLETGVRLHQAMREVDEVDRLQKAIIDAIAEESPDLARRIYLKIDAIAASWGGCCAWLLNPILRRILLSGSSWPVKSAVGNSSP
jgi:hypothetical protein